MQPLELLAVSYAIDRINDIHGLDLKLNSTLTYHPLVFCMGSVPHSNLTGNPITLAGETVKLENDSIIAKSFTYKIGDPNMDRRICGYIIQLLDGVAIPSFAAVVSMIFMAKSAFADPRTAIDHIIARDGAMRAYKREIDTLQSRIQLLSEIKE